MYCDYCGEVIMIDDPHYEMPDGDIVCDDCLEDWADKYHLMGAVDLCGEGMDDVRVP